MEVISKVNRKAVRRSLHRMVRPLSCEIQGNEVKASGSSVALELPVRPKNEVMFADLRKVFNRLLVRTGNKVYLVVADHISTVLVSPDW